MARILIAEDYDDLLEMIGELLAGLGHIVEAYAEGTAVLAALDNRDFDLLILDWELPNVLGIDICRQFRAGGGTSPILMLTGKRAVLDKEQGFDAGADDYLTKPFHPKELNARIKALLRRSDRKTASNSLFQQLEPDTTFAERYQIISALGRGSTGVIYKAMHRFLHRLVALKVLHPQLISQPESVARFKREAQAVSSLSHPNIIGIYDFGITIQGLPYIVMDYSDGVTVAQRIKKEQQLVPGKALPIFIQACDALAHAHSRGIIHRDVKPSNMLLVAGPSGKEMLKVADFGIARMPQGGEALEITQKGDVLGSPLYMSPEQCMGQLLDHRTDIFSLGCSMYMALAGIEPFSGENVLDTMYRRTVEDALPITEIRPELQLPKTLEAIILKALAREVNNRYQSMDELRSDLNRVAQAFA